MGLDMYLTGENHFMQPGRKRGEVKAHLYDLGYWRKHPNLHGYIVEHFADDHDDCRRIHLGETGIKQIIRAIRKQELPHTTGFFFGESDGSERERDIRIFSDALKWLRGSTPDEFRSVYYQASW